MTPWRIAPTVRLPTHQASQPRANAYTEVERGTVRVGERVAESADLVDAPRRLGADVDVSLPVECGVSSASASIWVRQDPAAGDGWAFARYVLSSSAMILSPSGQGGSS